MSYLVFFSVLPTLLSDALLLCLFLYSASAFLFLPGSAHLLLAVSLRKSRERNHDYDHDNESTHLLALPAEQRMRASVTREKVGINRGHH
eukprot:2200429-Rhodomonas_salina.1